MKVAEVYFSATDNTKVSVHEMAAAIAGGTTEVIDVTSGSSALVTRAFGEEDVVVVGMPVYGGRCPKLAMERLAGITGKGTTCIVVVTYGNRDYDDALLELCDVMKERGFIVKGAAALIGKHTFGEIQVTRPDADDLEACRSFALQAMENDNKNVSVKGNRPYKDGGNGGSFRPSTTDACVKCGLCVKKCSAHAIDTDCKSISDACISCFRCIKVCPMHAKQMMSEAYDEFAAGFTARLSKRLENEFFL
ncbi:MAG: hypothetical protein R3Y47_01320 [Lachnospiraceae bacterium]